MELQLKNAIFACIFRKIRILVTSHEIIKQFAAGDRRAFETIFKGYYPRVLAFLQGMLKNDADAQDVAQSVFIRLWTKRSYFERVDNFDAYIYRLTRNAMLNFLQSAHLPMAPMDTRQDEAAPTSPHEDLVAHDLQLLTDLIVSRMPRQRQVIYRLSRQSGLTNGEISEQLGISKKTVENHLNLALGELRKAILLFLFFVNNLGAVEL